MIRSIASTLALLLALAGCAAGEPAAPLTAPSIPIALLKPDGAGPFPILHDCGGLGPRSSGSPRRWANLLVKVYPNAHHSFDNANPKRFVANRNNMNAPGGKGATTEGNPDAWADSIREVTAFFRAQLGPR